jgi:hypothetical protein
VSRESAATCPLSAGELPLLALARAIPETALLDLRALAARVGDPRRRCFLHLAVCPTCAREVLMGEALSCAKGARLVSAARGWRSRRAA